MSLEIYVCNILQIEYTCIYICICIENIFCTDMCNQRQVWVRMLPGSCLWCQSINSFYTAEGWREICTLIFPLVQSHTLQLCILNKSWNILSMNNAFGVFSFIHKKKDACFDKNPCLRFILKAAELKLNTTRK